MAFDLDMYRFLIKPIREEDQRTGNLFVKRFLMGGQEVWKTTEQNTEAIKDLWSITDCPDEYLQYLKNIVGWTSELDHITKGLDYATLRRLISVSVPLWKSKTTEDAVKQILNVIGPARSRILNWFDLRWVLDETIFSVEHQGRDPWIVNMPGPTEDQEYWSIIRIVDPGAAKHQLVKDVVNLMRPAGERYLIVYLLFLDLFELDGDASQWEIVSGSDPTVSGGMIQLADDAELEIVTANVGGSADWDEYVVASRVRGGSSSGAGFGVVFYLQSSIKYYYAILDVDANKLKLYKKTSSGAPTLIAEKDFSGILTLVADVWYGLRVQVSPDGATNRIKVYLDGEEWINATDKAIFKGTAGLIHTSGITMDSDMIEVLGLPVVSDTVEINY